MTVKRIVADIHMPDPGVARAFYRDVLGLDVVMDQGWILTFASDAITSPQISFASEGGSGAPVPDLSIEVDDVDQVYAKAHEAGHQITREICDEPWGVRRFFVRDPAGKIVNILSHNSAD